MFALLALLITLPAQAGLWAELDKDDVVLRVILADQDFIKTMPGRWVETDDEGKKSKNRANVGFKWDAQRNGFIPKKPVGKPNFKLNEVNLRWEPPEVAPQGWGCPEFCEWNEDKQRWEKAPKPQR